MSTIDSQEIFKASRPSFSAANRQTLLWSVSAFVGILVAAVGVLGYVKDLPPLILHSRSWMIVGGILFLASVAGFLDRSGTVRIWHGRRPRSLEIRLRIESYYRKGQELYFRLENDSAISAEDVRLLIATEWVNPVTEYLRATVGERQAAEFLCIAQSCEPDESAVKQFGYPKAVARIRILDRLGRLRAALLDLH